MTEEETRTKAPISTRFAEEMRAAFGEVKLQRVREGDVVIGKTHEVVGAPCIHGAGGKPLAEIFRDEPWRK
jgi:hypothetical protein